MEIIISNSSEKPIYEQICIQIKNLIMNGALSAGEALPSMRVLARDLHISVITVQRAYEDLTRDGFIETVSGKGSFVAAQNREFIREEQLQAAILEKSLCGLFSRLLQTAFEGKVRVSDEIVNQTKVRVGGDLKPLQIPLYMGCPNRRQVKKTVTDYYLGGGE